MIDWYHAFIACTLLLWIVSTPRDRNALRIVLIASLASEVIVDFITSHIDGAWKLAIPGSVEVMTILALLKWARNRTGILQAGILVFAWLAHLLCYVDTLLKTDLVYSRYEIIIFWVAVGQLAICYDTIHFNLILAYNTTRAIWSDCFFGIPSASNSSALSLVSVDKKIQKAERNCAAGRNTPLIQK